MIFTPCFKVTHATFFPYKFYKHKILIIFFYYPVTYYSQKQEWLLICPLFSFHFKAFLKYFDYFQNVLIENAFPVKSFLIRQNSILNE